MTFSKFYQRKKQDSDKVTDAERKMIRSYAGKLGWLGRTTRPDLLFAQIEASSNVTRATVKDLKDLSKAVSKIPVNKSVMKFPRLPKAFKDWSIELETDASWQNLAGEGSTGGRIVFLVGGGCKIPIYWATNRLRRICHSSQAAEIMAMNLGLNDASFIVEMLAELTGVRMELEMKIDNKNA